MRAPLVALWCSAPCVAATLEVSVVDEHGRPIERVAVYAQAKHAVSGSEASGHAVSVEHTHEAIMDQHDQRFVPHMLVVETGTSVVFPNGDDTSHHVYSFSPAKTFELPLYKGDVYPPVVFDKPGVVVLGCNIHDGMLGYIVVVDTPHFAVTNERGVALIEDVQSGEYGVQVWTPRVRPAGLPPAQQLDVAADGVAAVEVRIMGRLAPDHDHGMSSLTWQRY